MVEAIKALWKGKCNIYVKKEVFDQITKRTVFSETLLYENKPCRISFRLPFRLSFKATAAANEKLDAASVRQTITMYISNEIDIPPGSKIAVTQNGITDIYQRSSKPSVYTNHQEILLELFKGWV